MNVVAPNKVLREADDRSCETLLAVVVRRVLRDVSSELSDLRSSSSANVSLEAHKRTLISSFIFFLKHAKRTFLCPGLKPSIMDGIERMLSAIEKRMSSLLIKSQRGTGTTLWSMYVPGCVRHHQLTQGKERGRKNAR